MNIEYGKVHNVVLDLSDSEPAVQDNYLNGAVRGFQAESLIGRKHADFLRLEKKGNRYDARRKSDNYPIEIRTVGCTGIFELSRSGSRGKDRSIDSNELQEFAKNNDFIVSRYVQTLPNVWHLNYVMHAGTTLLKMATIKGVLSKSTVDAIFEPVTELAA